ncbi:MAG TPA: MotA/TolQ/ExbB proton channel family protein [Candidatus Methylacidiphilales bacterium]|nr:MotA/TolQ/ExbB proton channel family protein [Candidatus Methylacidiphilales bacterium]
MKQFLFAMAGLFATATAAMAQTTGNDAVTELTKDTSLLSMVFSAGWVMIPLALASMITLTLIIFCFFTLTEKSITTPELLDRMEPFFENEDLEGLARYVADRPQATARIIDRTLLFLERHPEAGAEAITAVAEAEGNRIAASLNQRVLFVMDVGVLAPLLGLFGTVVGILNSFGHIAQQASPMRTMLLAGGVSQALVSTAAGLTIGITAMAFYAYFRGRVGHLISILEAEATLLTQELILLSKRHRLTPGS